MSWWQHLWPWRQPPPRPERPPPVREHMPELHDLRGAITPERIRMELMERELARLRGEATFDRPGREGDRG